MLVFFDFETYSEADIQTTGAVKYALDESTRPICLAYAFDGGPVLAWESGQPMPEDLAAATENPSALFVAHNEIFDRTIWNECLPFCDAPLTRDRVLCAQAQTEGSSVPGGLGAAAECLKAPHLKNADGKKLMAKFCGPYAGEKTPEEWARFVQYCKDDVAAMREVWLRCRPMTKAEWEQYHAAAEINDRGLPVDVAFAKAAIPVAQLAMQKLDARLQELTGDPEITLNHHARKSAWLAPRLTPEQRELVSTESGTVSSSKDARTELWACEDLSDEVEEFLDICDDANIAAITKLPRIPEMACADGRLRGIYVFNGAGQTGRFSARGYQAHNLINIAYKEGDPNAAVDAMDAICTLSPEEALAWLERDSEASALSSLGRLLRPLVAAEEGHDLVWGDLASIEARTAPWLAGTRAAEKKLAVFRQGRDPYIETAADMYRVPANTIDKKDPRRQEGKIAELSLGYEGGQRALRNMARKFGVRMSRDEALRIVGMWRTANPWAVRFWSDLNDAAKEAVSTPGARFKVGRLSYQFVPKLMGGTLTCRLPSGRILCYPQAKLVADEDEKGRRSLEIEYKRAKGTRWVRGRLYGGILANNATQGTANCLLRDILVRLRGRPVVGHTHDEVILEVPCADTAAEVARLREMMTQAPAWAEGLPLKVEVEYGPFWTK